VVSAAAATCLLLGGPCLDPRLVPLNQSTQTSALVSVAVRSGLGLGLGVPAAYADDDVDGRAEAVFAAASEATAAAESTASVNAPAAASDLQIVEEVWKVVDDNFLPARNASGFDRAAWGALREGYLARPPQSRAEAYATVRDILHTLNDPFSRFVEPADFAPLLKYDISGAGLRVWGAGCEVWGLGCKVWCSGLGYGVRGLGLGI